MSGLMNLVSRVTRGATTGRRPAATRGRRPMAATRGTRGTAHGRGSASTLEGTARRLLRRAR